MKKIYSIVLLLSMGFYISLSGSSDQSGQSPHQVLEKHDVNFSDKDSNNEIIKIPEYLHDIIMDYAINPESFKKKIDEIKVILQELNFKHWINKQKEIDGRSPVDALYFAIKEAGSLKLDQEESAKFSKILLNKIRILIQYKEVVWWQSFNFGFNSIDAACKFLYTPAYVESILLTDGKQYPLLLTWSSNTEYEIKKDRLDTLCEILTCAEKRGFPRQMPFDAFLNKNISRMFLKLLKWDDTLQKYVSLLSVV